MFPGFDGKLPGEDFMHSFYPIAIALCVGFVYGLRSWMRGSQCPSQARVDGKTAIVTGANTGIGLETARILAERGARVILACRDANKAKIAADDIKATTGNQAVEVMICDLACLQSVREFVTTFNMKEERLDILVSNAGVMCVPSANTIDKLELHFQTNYLGHFLLTLLLLEKLKSNPDGARIINLSATAYQIGELDIDDLQFETRPYKPGEAYSQSKLAVMLFTLHLAHCLEGTKVTVNAVNPGVVRTGIHRFMPFRQNAIVSWTFAPFLWFLMKNAKDGAQTVVHCAVAAEEKEVSGKYYSECKLAPVREVALNKELAEKLWIKSHQLCGLSI